MKRVAFDACFLTEVFVEKNSVKGSAYRQLIKDLEKDGVQIIVPAPSLAELLVAIDNVEDFMKIFDKKKNFIIVPFDQKASVECSFMLKILFKDKNRKKAFDRQKVKFDHQIAAISKSWGVECLYTDDLELSKHCRLLGLECKGFGDLEPPSEPELLLQGGSSLKKDNIVFLNHN